MQVVKANPSGKTEKQTMLKDVGVGKVVRFPSITFEEALTRGEGSEFYIVIEPQPNQKKGGRVFLMTIDFKQTVERDDDRLVVVHPAKVEVDEAGVN